MFNYVTPAELPGLIPSMATVTNDVLAARFISDAEAMIDALAGPAPRFYAPGIAGHFAALVASGASGISASVFGTRRPNYWAVGGLYVRVSDSTESSIIGQQRLIIASDSSEGVTLASGFSADAPAGTEFVLEQNSAFPREWDQDPFGSPVLPFLLDRAVAAQVEFGIMAGSEDFGLGSSSLVTDAEGGVTSRTYGSGYSESRDANRRNGLAVFVAPRARAIMLAGKLLNTAGYL